MPIAERCMIERTAFWVITSALKPWRDEQMEAIADSSEVVGPLTTNGRKERDDGHTNRQTERR